tara:strand:+ start:2320 stop:3144 length:825 start_codon:yes stop_codon:yes gene_type:complete
MKIILLIMIFFSSLFSQEKIDLLINDVLSGIKDSANYYLPLLESRYPNNSKMLFLKGLLEHDGEKAMKVFVDLYNNHPTSEYGDDAVMKVSEYYYASGLYIKSAEWLKKMPLFYSRSEHIERALKLFMNSLIVSGNKDTAIFYSKVFKRQFPQIDVDEKINSLLINYDDLKLIEEHNLQKHDHGDKKSNFFKARKINKNKFSLQSGAFGSKENAEKQRLLINGAGFDARIVDLKRNDKRLYIVRIGYFESRENAEKVANNIKLKLDLSTIIINN